MLVSSVSPTELCSIGAAARATGISTDSIRIWERRYGRPEPVRLASGHRRYTAAQVQWLRRVGQALALGMRAGIVVPLSIDELDSLLGRGEAATPTVEVQGFIQGVMAFDRYGLEKSLRQFYQTNGLLDFFNRCLKPLMTAIGEAWSAGELQVRHEHFFTEVCQDVLRSMRLASWHGEGRHRLLLTSLSGERHSLGLQMVGLLCAVHDCSPLILGCSTPTTEIASAARELDVQGVVISISTWTGGIDTDVELRQLRQAIPDSTPLIVGGEGARGPRRGIAGITYVEEWPQFIEWIEAL